MSEQKLIINDELCALLLQLLELHRSELITRYEQILREALFNSRTTIRPRMLKTIASDEVDAFAGFLQPSGQDWLAHGEELYHAGLNVQPVLGMGQVMRQFVVAHLESRYVGSALDLFDIYQAQIIQGFIQGLEQAVFSEQERTRHAFERVVKREQS